MPRNAESRNTCHLQSVLLCVRYKIDMVAGDFNGAAWRKKSGEDHQRDGTIEEAFANTNLPIPNGSSPLWGPGNVPGERADVCGFIKQPNTDGE